MGQKWGQKWVKNGSKMGYFGVLGHPGQYGLAQPGLANTGKY